MGYSSISHPPPRPIHSTFTAAPAVTWGSLRTGTERMRVVGAGCGREPVVSQHSPFLPTLHRAMSHQILLLLAVLTLGQATSQHQDKMPCKMVRSPAQAR